jgi:hypothetical protein
MPEWQTRCGKWEYRSDDRDPPFRRDPCHGCVRVRYQTMGITGWENREWQLTHLGRFSPTSAMGHGPTKTPIVCLASDNRHSCLDFRQIHAPSNQEVTFAVRYDRNLLAKTDLPVTWCGGF